MENKFASPSYWKRFSSVWIDFIFLVGAYLVLGFISENIYLRDAYPPPTGMQFYSERDFLVYWFFVRWTLILSGVYLFVCYKFFGATIGQKIVGIKLLHKEFKDLTLVNILLRVLSVFFILLLLMGPGPVAALLFILIGAEILNVAFSVALLLAVVFILFYISFTRYSKGATRSYKDMISMTVMLPKLLKTKIDGLQ